VPQKKTEGIELSVFKDKEGKLNRAILQILSNKALVKYDVHKAIIKQGFKKTRYGTIQNRMEILEETRYIKQAGTRKTQPGSEGILYTATFKALAALKANITNFEASFSQMSEGTAIDLLALIALMQTEQQHT
jgi:DNA-binding PadR family transcriptional regulator